MNKPMIALWMAFFLSSCVGSKKMTAFEEPWSIGFGYSGGATNVPVEYVLSHNRQLHKVSGDSLIFTNNVSRRNMNKLTDLMEDMDFNGIKLVDYGNITYFISVQSPAMNHRISWSQQSDSQGIINLYQALFELVKQ